MNTRPVTILARALLALIAAAIPVMAHHSFAAEFDINKPITAVGTVTKVMWSNPHVYIFMSIKDEKGDAADWGFELGGPNSLLRLGWTRDAVKAGDMLTIDGYRAKDGSRLANARVIKLPDGRKLFAGSMANVNNPTQ